VRRHGEILHSSGESNRRHKFASGCLLTKLSQLRRRTKWTSKWTDGGWMARGLHKGGGGGGERERESEKERDSEVEA
jgi:hypothetical protein